MGTERLSELIRESGLSLWSPEPDCHEITISFDSREGAEEAFEILCLIAGGSDGEA